jgi:CubicO group peptidase (beta-lactamase class C family)
VSEAPGTAFDYNDYQTMLLWSLLYEKVNSATPDEATDKVLRLQLFDLIEAEDKPYLRIRENAPVSGRLAVSPRDFVRLGLVYLHGGKWKDRQVISAEHVQLALRTPVTVPRTTGKDAEMLPDAKSYGGGKNQEEHLGCYSFMWWLNTDRKLWPSLPPDAFAAVGNGGVKVLMVVPSLDLVVAWNNANMKPLPLYTDGKVQMEAVLKKLMAAVR